MTSCDLFQSALHHKFQAISLAWLVACISIMAGFMLAGMFLVGTEEPIDHEYPRNRCPSCGERL